MAKTVLIPQTTFVAEQGKGVLLYSWDGIKTDADKINVIFDGVTYKDILKEERHDDSETFFVYGIFDADDKPVFSTYPFGLKSYILDESTFVYVQDQNEHTIEVYVEDEPVVTVQKPGVQVLQLDERLIIFDETTGDIVTFDGENWLLGNDGFGTGVLPSKYAVVGTAIVGKDIVGPSHTVGYAIVGTDEVGGV